VPSSSEDRIYETLKDSLLEGRLESGNRISKVDYLARIHHVSKDAICSALDRLAHSNLVHKAGKLWVAGPAPRLPRFSGAPHSPHMGPVVLVIAPWDVEARDLFVAAHPSAFATAFRLELAKYGYSFVVATQYPQPADFIPISGIDTVRRLVRRLGPRYAGALLAYIALAYEPELWVSELRRFGKPVVVFDAVGRVSSSLRDSIAGGDKVYRLYFDEQSAVTRALEFLLEHGHRTIATFDLQPGTPDSYSARRIDLMRNTLRAIDRTAVLVAAQQDDPVWAPQWERPQRSTPLLTIPEILHAARRKARTGVRHMSAAELLRTNSPTFLSTLRQGVTAILAVNDIASMDYYLWLTALKVRVPQEISLLGFDNAADVQVFPLSTIDFGFPQLGYRAAHIMIGDIPAHADAGGNIAGTITLIDKGSVQNPPARALGVRLSA